MKFDPPVSDRPTKELLNIVSNDDNWIKDIQVLAEEELCRRGFTEQTIAAEKQKRISIIQKLKERKANRLERNSTESYTISEMIVIALFFPLSFFFGSTGLTEFSKLAAGNFKKKIWQRIILIIVSVILWLTLIMQLV